MPHRRSRRSAPRSSCHERSSLTPPRMSDDREASSRFPWPPAIYGSAFLAAAVLAWFVPLHFLPDGAAWLVQLAGVLIIVAAVGLAVVAEREFRRARTPALPTLPTRTIVKNGVYAYT